MTAKFDMSKICDMHIHCGPEPIPRKFDCLGLSRELKAYDMGGAVIKSHFYSTVPFAALSDIYAEGNLWGSIVLNHYVGGINPDVIRGSLGQKRNGVSLLRVVWMPTMHAESHLKMQMEHGQVFDIPAEWTGGDKAGGSRKIEEITPINILAPEVQDNLKEVLSLIAANDIVLATGHLSRDEVFYLVPLAKEMGVKKIILTHPVYEATGLTVDEIAELCAIDGIYAEISYGLMPIDNLPLEVIAEPILKLGPEKIILTTDLGQPKQITPPEGMQKFLEALAGLGISEEALQKMAAENPAYLLGI